MKSCVAKYSLSAFVYFAIKFYEITEIKFRFSLKSLVIMFNSSHKWTHLPKGKILFHFEYFPPPTPHPQLNLSAGKFTYICFKKTWFITKILQFATGKYLDKSLIIEKKSLIIG